GTRSSSLRALRLVSFYRRSWPCRGLPLGTLCRIACRREGYSAFALRTVGICLKWNRFGLENFSLVANVPGDKAAWKRVTEGLLQTEADGTRYKQRSYFVLCLMRRLHLGRKSRPEAT
ncbi:unnamed protein product, partial [Ectocarpus sp. 12 AP-2014]